MIGFSIIVAATALSNGIGKGGKMTWRLKGDMERFKAITCGTYKSNKQETNKLRNIVIMGRKTYESIPKKFRPLSDRINIVLSRNKDIRQTLELPDDVFLATSLSEALRMANDENILPNSGDVFVIGGGMIYDEALHSDYCRRIYFTEVSSIDAADTRLENLDAFFPVIPATRFRISSRSNSFTEDNLRYRYLDFDNIENESLSSIDDKLDITAKNTLLRNSSQEEKSASTESTNINCEEEQYLDIIRNILATGVKRGDRTGTGTISKFGVQMRFSLRNHVFPLLTTKKVFWRGVAEELLWFVSGSTNANKLSEKGIHIWDGNGSREYLDQLGFRDREVGDLGPVYGFQWRHFGAKYVDMHTDYAGHGIDQLKGCINKMKTNPEDRRILLTAWNPSDLDQMALPPCHMFCQFYVANGELSCQMYQRSADMGLGVPFNIASYALLTLMVAQVCNLKPGDFVHTIGDAHIYLNHVEALQEQLTRKPNPFPTIKINSNVTDIDSFKFEDFEIIDYHPHASISMKMAV